MRNEIQLTDEQIEEVFDEEFSIGLTVGDLTFTRDTVDDFKAERERYAEPGRIEGDGVGRGGLAVDADPVADAVPVEAGKDGVTAGQQSAVALL